MSACPYFGWTHVLRVGMVQACLGAVVVLTTSTLNRVMVVELALPALLPGLLVALHYLMQVARPRMGFGSDTGGRRTPWIIGGMAVLAGGGSLASLATAWMAHNRGAGIALAVIAFMLIGLGVSASGTSLLVMLAKRVEPARRAAAATVVWVMMIAGFAVTSGAAGALLDPYSPSRLVLVTTGVCLLALALTLVCVRGLEGPAAQPADPAGAPAEQARFIHALGQVWREPVARRFTVFVFLSMLAYSAQDLILEPFAGTVFGLTPGQSTSLSGVQHGGVLLGMLLMALAATVAARMGWPAGASLRGWTTGGCLLSAAALASLAGAGLVGPGWPMRTTVFVLGVANGVFSIGAISSMMRLAAEGRHAREGVRMGLWGAAQAIAFGLGGLLGTAASDLARWLIASPGAAYGSVFALEALLFLLSAVLAWRLAGPQESQRSAAGTAPGFPGAATSLSTE